MYVAAVTPLYHTGVVGLGDFDANLGSNADTSLIPRRVVDVIIEDSFPPRMNRPAKVAVDTNQRC